MLPFVRDWLLPARDWSAVDAFQAIAQIGRVREAAVGACDPFGHIAFTAPFNQSEQPACSVPCGMTGDGLPIVGHRFDDLGVLQVARAYERLRDPLPAWPEP